MNVLGIGLDYLMLKDDMVRGDVRERQFDYAKCLKSLHLIVYSPKELDLKLQEWTNNLWVYPTNSKNKASFVFDALRIASEICKTKKIDVITTEDPFMTGLVGYLLKRKFRIPLNMQAHNDFCDNKYWMNIRKVNWVFNNLGKFNLRRADTIRVGTKYEKNKLTKKINLDQNKIFVIPVNADLSRFKNIDGEAIRNKLLKGKFNKILLFTGRLVQQKDIPTLFKAFRIVRDKIPSVLLTIIGSGAQEEMLRRLTNDLGINDNVIFTGSIEHNKISEYLAACDVYTISSIFEGTCIAMVEAMAAEKPVVATKFAGAHDLIRDGDTGYAVDQGDSHRFANRVLHLLDNSEEAKRMGQKASVFIQERFANNKNIDEMIRLWEQTAKA